MAFHFTITITGRADSLGRQPFTVDWQERAPPYCSSCGGVVRVRPDEIMCDKCGTVTERMPRSQCYFANVNDYLGDLERRLPGGFAEIIGLEEFGGPAQAPTVKKVDLFGVVHDTYQTEAELNGWRPSQAPLW